jgi:Domain of unknown function (DUF3850)
MSTLHKLKTNPETFDAAWIGVKRAELRNNDRNFTVGDLLLLQETLSSAAMMAYRPEAYPLVYTGRELEVQISHIQRGYGLARDCVMLSFIVMHHIQK